MDINAFFASCCATAKTSPLAIFKMQPPDESKFKNIAYLFPATVVFLFQGANILTGIVSNFEHMKKFEGAALSLITIVSLFLLGVLAISALWYLVLFPLTLVSMSNNKRDLVGIIVVFGFLVCSFNYVVSISDIQSSLLYHYPPIDEAKWSALFAICSIGPLRLVSKLYFNWSFKKFYFGLFLSTLLLLSQPYLVALVWPHR